MAEIVCIAQLINYIGTVKSSGQSIDTLPPLLSLPSHNTAVLGGLPRYPSIIGFLIYISLHVTAKSKLPLGLQADARITDKMISIISFSSTEDLLDEDGGDPKSPPWDMLAHAEADLSDVL